MPALGLEWEAAARPLLEPAGHRVRLPAGTAKGMGRHRRARTDPAVEHDRRVAIDRLRLGGEAPDLQVARAGDPPCRVLVGLADVDQLDLAALVGGADLSGVDVDGIRVHVKGTLPPPLRPGAPLPRPGAGRTRAGAPPAPPHPSRARAPRAAAAPRARASSSCGGSLAGMWSNWSGGQSCAPAEHVRPGSRAELAAAVARGRAVRVAGAGHSFSGGVPTDGTLLSLDRLDRVLDVDRASGLVRVEAGIGLRQLVRALHAHGLALPNLGDVDAQSLAGALATGTHGTGVRLGNLSTAVTAMELVLADGSERVVDAGGELAAARVGL